MSNENLFIVPSIRPFPYWADYLKNFSKNGHDISKMDVLIVDEGEEIGRAAMKQLYPETNFEFFGPKEREDFFMSRFGEKYKNFMSVIPERNHAETSFGMLVALERKPKFVYMVDDDTTPVMEHDFVGMHTKIVGKQINSTISASSKWYNTMDALEYAGPGKMIGYPRGFPYAARFIQNSETKENAGGRIAINQGLWLNVPDWDSINITSEGGLDGLSRTRVSALKHNEIVLSKGTFTTVCSMNVCFSPDIIPAYYQLPMGGMGISRFDDIWSGIFVKKVCDAVGDCMSLGAPCVIHNKEKRNVFKDLRAELEGIIINEHLWKLTDSAQINAKDYFTGYEELIASLKKGVEGHNPPLDQNTRKYWAFLLRKMSLWLNVCDKLM